MRKRITLSIIALTLLAPTQAHAKEDTSTHRQYKGVMSDHFYRTLAKCETNLNWQHDTRSYTSAFGIARGTWQRWSNSSSAQGKDPIYQVRVVDNIAFHGHTTDGVFKPPTGLWGWGCIRRSKKLQAIICKSRNPLVYRQRRHC